ncbi:MAG: MATE family efflux transporter [Planctomycetes bacterium]|nr:MATE family efflux transporter [Planctomycetota bacterium]
MKSTKPKKRAADADRDVPMTSIGPDDPADTLMAVAEIDADSFESGEIRSGRLAGKSMWSAIWILALPVLLQQLMAACVGMTDKILAGNLPSKVVVPAMDGIGIGTYVGWFTGIALAGLGVGGQAIIARAMGSGNKRDAHEALGASVTLGVVWGALVGLFMWLLAAPLAAVSGLSPEAAAHCSTYVSVIAWSMPFCGVMTVGGMCLHGAGETTKPSLISIGINVINLFASWMLSGVVLRFNGNELPAPLSIDPETWGVWGIAAGTSLSYIVGGIATVWVMVRGVKDLRLEKKTLKPKRKIAWRITRLGIPNFFEGLAMWGSSLFIMGFIGQIARGATGLPPHQGLIGAHMITVQWEAFSFLPGFAMGTAAGALAGQYLGAKNPQMARKAIWACTVLGMSIMGAMGILFMTEGRFLASIISSEPVHLDEVPKLLFACGTVQVFFALSMTVRQGLRGVGDVKWILAITVGSIYAIRLPLAWALGVWMGYGLAGIWWGLSLELGIRGLLFLARFRYGNWQRLRV